MFSFIEIEFYNNKFFLWFLIIYVGCFSVLCRKYMLFKIVIGK